ncbi:MAG: tRNA pseudouridine(38-40) synthase TruA [Terrimicrobiaceae bacterium]
MAYDGGVFAGWQSQPGRGTVQDTIGAAFYETTGLTVSIHGAGRTDSGVHALGQCFHVDTAGTSLRPSDWVRALNARLPSSVRILSARQVPEDFHARFSAVGKHYRYLLRTREVLPPHEAGRVWHFPRRLDEDLAKRVAGMFQGTHNFAAFAANRGQPYHDTSRTLTGVTVKHRGTLWQVDMVGTGFLYKMVRLLVGAIFRCASGRCPPELVEASLRDPTIKWPHVAPADGLYLMRVIYPGISGPHYRDDIR